MAKVYFDELGNSQSIDDETLEWSCTCKHGSLSRWAKRTQYPCCCVWSALNKLSYRKILLKRAKTNAIRKTQRSKDKLSEVATE